MTEHVRSAPPGRRQSGPTLTRFAVDILVWFVLATLLALTAVLAYVPMGTGNLIFGLAIATAKMVLVALFYMHLNSASALLRLVSIVGLVFLAVLGGLTLADVLTR